MEFGESKVDKKTKYKKKAKTIDVEIHGTNNTPQEEQSHFLHKTHICMANKSPHRAGLFKRGLRQMKTHKCKISANRLGLIVS